MMKPLIPVLFLILSWASTVLAVDEAKSSRPLTEDQALSMLRSRTKDADAGGFVVVDAIEPDPAAREAVTQPKVDAGKEVSKDEFPANCMRVGGFVILEYNVKTEKATQLHLVTVHKSGEPNIVSNEIEGDMNREDALKLLKKTEAFSRAFINADLSEFKSILVEYAGSDVLNNLNPEAYGCLWLPASLAKLAMNSDETLDFVALACGTFSRFLRHALTLPIYGEDPFQGLAHAADDLKKAEEAFAAEKGVSADDADPLRNLDKLSTPHEFARRLQLLAEVDKYLDKHLSVQSETESYRRHLQFSLIPLRLTANGEPNLQYGVFSATGLGTLWSRTAGGDFVMTGMGVVTE
jgi:hypothetical protein